MIALINNQSYAAACRIDTHENISHWLAPFGTSVLVELGIFSVTILYGFANIVVRLSDTIPLFLDIQGSLT